MKSLLLIAAASLALAGCQSTSFLGTGTPCEKAALVHAAFVTVAASTPKITPDMKRAERSLYAGVSAACASGSDIKSVNLVQLVNAYTAAVSEYQN